jgi:hypothetical protein
VGPDGNQVGLRDSGILDIVSDLAIPIPAPSADPFRGQIQLATKLRRVSEQLREKILRFDDVGFLAIDPSPFGLSQSAMGSAMRLYSEFLAALENPLLFDSVVDLVDAFLNLFEILRFEQSQNQLAITKEDHRLVRLRIRESILESLTALKEGFYNRVERASAKRDERNVRVELKGSLNALVAAADAALKCSLGMLRFTLFGANKFHDPGFRRRLTGVVSGCLNQKAIAHVLSIPSDEYRTFSSISMDVAHLFEPEQLCRIIHEVGHSIFKLRYFGDHGQIAPRISIALAKLGQSPEEVLAATTENRLREYHALLSEYFAEMLVFKRIFFSSERYVYVHYYFSAREQMLKAGDARGGPLHVLAYELGRAFLISFDYQSIASTGQDFEPELVRLFKIFSESLFERNDDLGNQLRSLWPDVSLEILQSIFKTMIRDAWLVKELVFPIFKDIQSYDAALGNEKSRDFYDRFTKAVDEGEALSFDLGEERIEEFWTLTEGLRAYCTHLANSSCRDEYGDSRFIWRAATIKLLWHLSTRQRARRLDELLQSVPST